MIHEDRQESPNLARAMGRRIGQDAIDACGRTAAYLCGRGFYAASLLAGENTEWKPVPHFLNGLMGENDALCLPWGKPLGDSG